MKTGLSLELICVQMLITNDSKVLILIAGGYLQHDHQRHRLRLKNVLSVLLFLLLIRVCKLFERNIKSLIVCGIVCENSFAPKRKTVTRFLFITNKNHTKFNITRHVQKKNTIL